MPTPPSENPLDAPQLAPPGAGLPPVEAALSRYILFPLYCRTMSWDKALKRFEAESLIIREMVKANWEKDLAKQVLIPPQRGLEDSSRFWSVLMTLEHLVIVNNGISDIILALSHNIPIQQEVSIADVKPRGNTEDTVIFQRFEQTSQDFLLRMHAELADRHGKSRHPHPWFGPLTAYQWACLAALHMGIHRKQIQTILGRVRIRPLQKPLD